MPNSHDIEQAKTDKILPRPYPKDTSIGRVFGFSFAVHIVLIFCIALFANIKKPLEPPKKVYSVKILPAPSQPVHKTTTEVKEDKLPEKKPDKKPEEKQKVVEDKKKKPDPKPKVEQKKTETKTEKVKEPKETKKEVVHGKGSASIKLDGQLLDNDWYLNAIITKIANFWRNPLNKGGKKISVIIYFKIQKDGVIKDPVIEKRSGNSVFDSYALRAVNDASPLPPLPDNYTSDFLGVHFEFEHTTD